MMGHKICFYGEIWIISLNYACYPFLSAALHHMQQYVCKYAPEELSTLVDVNVHYNNKDL